MGSAYRLERRLAAPAIAVLLAGCVYGTDPANSARTDGDSGADRPGSAAPVNGGAHLDEAAAPLASNRADGADGARGAEDVAPRFAGAQGSRTDQERLARLWRERTGGGRTADFTLGPGDIIEVSVPVVADLKDRVERIAGNGTLSLPYVGTVGAAGLTEKQLKTAITERLSAIMYKPQVDVFVKEYHSRQVAVVGQVDKPGLYDMTSPSNTLLDMLNDAGGTRQEAAQRVLFIPAHDNRPGAPAPGGTGASTGGGAMSIAALAPGAVQEALRTRHPIEIGLGNLSRGGDPAALMLPARPGDMLVVPDAGEVVVQGWVEKPGSYKITPGLTVAGAVGAAGGALFASDERAVTIMRNSGSGKKIFITADLDKIDAGQAADVPVQAGDLVSVPYSMVKLVPYGAVSLIGRGLYLSAAAPIF